VFHKQAIAKKKKAEKQTTNYITSLRKYLPIEKKHTHTKTKGYKRNNNKECAHVKKKKKKRKNLTLCKQTRFMINYRD